MVATIPVAVLIAKGYVAEIEGNSNAIAEIALIGDAIIVGAVSVVALTARISIIIAVIISVLVVIVSVAVIVTVTALIISATVLVGRVGACYTRPKRDNRRGQK